MGFVVSILKRIPLLIFLKNFMKIAGILFFLDIKEQL